MEGYGRRRVGRGHSPFVDVSREYSTLRDISGHFEGDALGASPSN
jgi:hypothetical protein